MLYCAGGCGIEGEGGECCTVLGIVGVRSALTRVVVSLQQSYQSRHGKKATFYLATPCRGAGIVPQKFYLGTVHCYSSSHSNHNGCLT